MIEQDVTEFHKKFHQPIGSDPHQELIEFRIERIEEEARELIEALRARDLAAVANEAVDLIYVTVGTLVALGIPLVPFWNVVHRANMDKEYVPPVDGRTQKPLKPEGWRKPIHRIREMMSSS